MPAHIRTTQSGACASCAAYGNTQHNSRTCEPEVKRVLQLGYSRQARRDVRLSDAVRAKEANDRKLMRRFGRVTATRVDAR
jgi:hypothetical protein